MRSWWLSVLHLGLRGQDILKNVCAAFGRTIKNRFPLETTRVWGFLNTSVLTTLVATAEDAVAVFGVRHQQ